MCVGWEETRWDWWDWVLYTAVHDASHLHSVCMDAYSQPQPTYRFQLVALLHDMGKIQFLWGGAEDGQRGTADGPQWVRI